MNTKDNFDYNRKKILGDLLKRKEQDENELYALRSIKRVHKKDGSDFQSFLKNFSYADDVYVRCDSSYKLFGTDIIFRYKGDEVCLSDCSTDKEFLEKVNETNPDRIVKEYLLKDRVYFTPDEFIDYKVNKAIKYREDDLAEVNAAITKFDIICGELYDKIKVLTDYIGSIEYEAYSFKKLASKTIDDFTNYK